MADGERRELLPLLPFGRERGGPAGVAVEAPFLVGEREGAVRPALQQQVLADAQHEQVHAAVAVDVDRVGADDVVEQLRIGADIERLLLERERPAARRPVDVELGAVLAAGEEHRGEARAVAVERRAAAADEEFPWTVVDRVDPRRRGLFVEQRHVADRLRARFVAQRRRRENDRGDRQNRPNRQRSPTHHGASMISERRNAITVSRWDLSSAR